MQSGFDPEWYLARNPDVASAKIDPLTHFLTFGWREGRDPNSMFRLNWYANNNPEIGSESNPFLHYARIGKRLGLRPNPLLPADISQVSKNPIAQSSGNISSAHRRREVVNAFWHGRPLSCLHWNCLSSFADHGHEVRLFVYEPIDVPSGVKLIDARSIIPADEVFFYANENLDVPDVGPFSDVFRFKLLKERGGWWVDAQGCSTLYSESMKQQGQKI